MIQICGLKEWNSQAIVVQRNSLFQKIDLRILGTLRIAPAINNYRCARTKFSHGKEILNFSKNKKIKSIAI